MNLYTIAGGVFLGLLAAALVLGLFGAVLLLCLTAGERRRERRARREDVRAALRRLDGPAPAADERRVAAPLCVDCGEWQSTGGPRCGGCAENHRAMPADLASLRTAQGYRVPDHPLGWTVERYQGEWIATRGQAAQRYDAERLAWVSA